MKKTILLLFFCVIFISSIVYSQSKETGALIGTLALEDGSPVAGVLVKISSKDVVISKSTITNEQGKYRFSGLQPGTYTLSATLEGFATAVQTGIKLSVGKTFTVDLRMKQGQISEEVVVTARPALVDVKDSATAKVDLTTEFLQNIPNSQFAPDAVNMAPGITADVAYGAADATGIAYQVDGIDVSDPAGGSSWVFLDYNIIEEVSISGIGAPAEYGGFTGVIFNSVTKSGGNSFKAYMEGLYQKEDWYKANTDDEDLKKTGDNFESIHLDVGGPLIKDKLTFFLSGLWYHTGAAITGQEYKLDYKQPKGFLKLSYQPTEKTRLTLWGEFDAYNGTGRGGNALTDYDATVKQVSPEAVGNLSFIHQFSDYTFLEGKMAYFWGYFSLEPVGAGYGHVDWATDEYWGNATWTARYDRTRFQANVDLNHHSDNFIAGSHDFKFGAQITSITQEDQWKITNGQYYVDWYGEPYLMYTYGDGFHTELGIKTTSFYVQDTWSVSDRLTINPGLRFDISSGSIKGMSGTQYKPKAGPAPRIGFTYDLFGDHKTALKAHWGRYYESAYGYTFGELQAPSSDWTSYYWDGSEYVFDYSIPAEESQYRMDGDIKQTYMDQFTVGFERTVGRDVSLGVTFIHRKNKDIIDYIDTGGIYEQGSFTSAFTEQTYTVWDQVNDQADSIYLITNPKAGDVAWLDVTPYRQYTGLEFLINKRFSNKWQLMASYVLSKAKGNHNNTFSGGYGGTGIYETPNYKLNAEGLLTNDYKHMLKIQGSVILPLDINLNINFHVISGQTYTMRERLPSSVDQNRSVIYVETLGSNREPTSKNLDIRLEKTFKLGDKVKVGVLLDVFNIFNEGIATSYSTYTTSFENITGIKDPRTFRLGLRLWY